MAIAGDEGRCRPGILAHQRHHHGLHMSSVNEAQTEEDLVKPILLTLGHTFEVQPALDTPGTPTKPDYVFYQDRDALLANEGKKRTEDLLTGRAFTTGDAKYWDRPLDVSLKGASHVFSNKNSSPQIEFSMRYSGVTWGILINGRFGRLYHKDSTRRLEHYRYALGFASHDHRTF